MKGLGLKVTQVLSSCLRSMTLKVPKKEKKKQNKRKKELVPVAFICQDHISKTPGPWRQLWKPPPPPHPAASRQNLLNPRTFCKTPRCILEPQWGLGEGVKLESKPASQWTGQSQTSQAGISPFLALGKSHPSLHQNGLVYGTGGMFSLTLEDVLICCKIEQFSPFLV